MAGKIANTGQVSIGEIESVIGGTVQAALSEYYQADDGISHATEPHYSGIGGAGTLKLSDFHGAVGYTPNIVLQKVVQTPLRYDTLIPGHQSGFFPAGACGSSNGGPWGNPVGHDCEYPIEIIPELTVMTKFADNMFPGVDFSDLGIYEPPTPYTFIHPKQEFTATMSGVIDDGWNLWMCITDTNLGLGGSLGGDGGVNETWTRIAYGREQGGGANSWQTSARIKLNLTPKMIEKTGYIIRFAHSCGPYWGNYVTNGTIKLDFPNFHPFKNWV
jgi:hypothetical protein